MQLQADLFTTNRLMSSLKALKPLFILCFTMRVCFACTNLLDCSGSVKPHPVLNFRGLQRESVRHVHAQHSHYFTSTPFFEVKLVNRVRFSWLNDALFFSSCGVCKSQPALVFHSNVAAGEGLCAVIGWCSCFCARIGGKFQRFQVDVTCAVSFCELIGGKFVPVSYIILLSRKNSSCLLKWIVFIINETL